jgi:hypothetical protein
MAKYQNYIVAHSALHTKSIILNRLGGRSCIENCSLFDHRTGPKWHQFFCSSRAKSA